MLLNLDNFLGSPSFLVSSVIIRNRKRWARIRLFVSIFTGYYLGILPVKEATEDFVNAFAVLQLTSNLWTMYIVQIVITSLHKLVLIIEAVLNLTITVPFIT